MLSELNEAKRFLIEKFGSVENVKPGTYPIPTNTSKGPAFMKVVINEEMGMSDFSLWLDEGFSKSWHEKELKIKCYTITIFGSTLMDTNIDNIFETLKVEIEENLDEDTIDFRFGIVYLTQDEVDNLPEFDGF